MKIYYQLIQWAGFLLLRNYKVLNLWIMGITEAATSSFSAQRLARLPSPPYDTASRVVSSDLGNNIDPPAMCWRSTYVSTLACKGAFAFVLLIFRSEKAIPDIPY